MFEFGRQGKRFGGLALLTSSGEERTDASRHGRRKCGSRIHLPSAALVAGLLIVVAAAGCRSKLKYDSHSQLKQLRSLNGKRILLLQFRYKSGVLADSEPLDASLGNRVAEQHRKLFNIQFGSLFALQDVSDRISELYGKDTELSDPVLVRRVLQEFGGDAGFVVENAYAYEMAGGSVKDEIRDAALRRVLSKKAVGVLAGPSQIRSYDLASKATLFDSEGTVIWTFFGKASALPTFSTILQPTEFMRSVAGLDPTTQNLAFKMSQVCHEYTLYLRWMMEQDLAGSGATNYFSDYENGKPKALSVFPAETKSYAPFVKGYTQLE
jgi:hypothetical protein